MAIFDIEKDDLLRLTETLLEELINRLCEAEVAAHGHSPAFVNWSGSINAPDEGIDIHVQVPSDEFSTGSIARHDTIFQSKINSMPKSAISKEMLKGGKLNPTISQQAKMSGGYVIVSLNDDCSERKRKNRLNAMQAAFAGDPNKDKIHLGFLIAQS